MLVNFHLFYFILQLTKKVRQIRVINITTKSEDIISTCCEDCIDDILEKYLEYNNHARSYTWKAIIGDEVVNLNMRKTLEENGLADESEMFYSLGVSDDTYIPSVLIYFNDDLTYA